MSWKRTARPNNTFEISTAGTTVWALAIVVDPFSEVDMGKIIGGDQSSRQYGNSVPISMLSPLPNLRNNMFIVNNVLHCGRFMTVGFQVGLQADAAPAFPDEMRPLRSEVTRGQSRWEGSV